MTKIELWLPLATTTLIGGFVSPHPGTANFVMASGSVHSLANDLDPVLLETLGNRADGAMMGDFDR